MSADSSPERRPLDERVERALEHIRAYECDMLGRVPLDVFALKRLLEDVRKALRGRGV